MFVARLQLIYCGDKCFGRYLIDGEAVVIKRIVWSLINLKAEIVKKIADKIRDEIQCRRLVIISSGVAW